MPQVSENNPSRAERPDDEINLLDFLVVLAKHWKSIVCVPIVVAVITALVTLLMPNVYTAKAIIVPGDDDNAGMMGAMLAQMGGLAGMAGGLVGGGSKADLYVTMLKSETVKDPVIDRLGLMKLYEARYRTDAYRNLDGSSQLNAGKKDGVITIEVSDNDPALAAKIANAYVEELGRLAAKLNMAGAGKNRGFLEERLYKAKADLAGAEEALKSFQSANKAVAVTDQAKASLEGVANLRAQLVSQEVQLATIRRQFTDQSQEVKAVKSSIANLRGQIAQLEGSGQGALPGIGAMPRLGQEYVRLMREFKIQETLVELLTKQFEMAKLSEAKNLAPFQVLQNAKIPEKKSKPRRALIVVIAALMSGLLMVLVAFAREYALKMSDEDRARWQELQRLLPRFQKSWRRSA